MCAFKLNCNEGTIPPSNCFCCMPALNATECDRVYCDAPEIILITAVGKWIFIDKLGVIEFGLNVNVFV